MATVKATKAAKGKKLLALVALAPLAVGMAPQQLEASRHLPGVDVEPAVIELQGIDTSDDPKPLTVDATSIHSQPSLLATALEDLPSLAALPASTSTSRSFRLLEPPVVFARVQNLASGGFQPLGERISLTRNAFRGESRIGNHFVQPDPLGYVDSHNLFQGLGYSGYNTLDPLGEAGIVKAKVGPGDWFETEDVEIGNAWLDYTVVGMYNEIRNGCALACNMGANVLWIFGSLERAAANWLIDKGLIDEIDLAFLESMAAGAYPTIAAQKARIEITQALARLKGVEGQAQIRKGLKRLLNRIVDWERRKRLEDPNYWERGSVRVGEAPQRGVWVRPTNWQGPGPTRGTWLGEVGNSEFRLADEFAESVGVPKGTRVQFVEGVPDYGPWAHPTPAGTSGVFDVPGLTGVYANDQPLIRKHLATEAGWTQAEVTRWLRKNRLRIHHFRGDTVQLAPSIHRLHHTGGAAALRGGNS